MKKETIEELFNMYNCMSNDYLSHYAEISTARKMINIVLLSEFGKTMEDFFDVEQDKYVFKED